MNFKCLALFVLCPSLFNCQRITCPTPCDIGFTCAMVRQGNSGIAPGCISMEEAILLHQALNGGPSGPGTGITSSVGQQPPIPQVSGITPIPGMNFHGSTVPEPRGFEQRFQQGLNQVPTSLFSPPNRPRQTGIGIAGPSLFGTGLPNTQRPIGFSNSGFLDPLSGQLPGPSVGGMPGQGFGIGQRIDGGDSFSRHAGASQTNSLGNTNRQPNLDSGGGGGGRITSPRNGGFPGEEFLANQNTNAGGNTLFPNTSSANLDFFQAQQSQVNGDANDTQTSRPERQGQVSRILEDSMGLHFLFYPRPNYPGIRVNITKNGFCRRDIMTRERNLCMNTCYSDQQCPRDLKCCPSGCSLGCMSPSIPDEDNAISVRVASGLNESPQAIESRCLPCQSHLDCNSQDQFCLMSDFCGRQMVCRLLIR